MKNFIGIILFGLIFATASSAQSFCFENDGLKSTHRISFTLKGNKIVEGYFQALDYDDTTNTEIFDFSGTKVGKTLKVKFDDGSIPYEPPPKTKMIVWTLSGNVLKVPSYGKNYETNKFSAYVSEYEKCAKD